MERYCIVEAYPEFRVFHVGWETLKGVLGGEPIPILWTEFVNPNSNHELEYNLEAGKSFHAARYIEVKPLDAGAYISFFGDWSESLRAMHVAHIEPYVNVDGTTDFTHIAKYSLGNVPNEPLISVLKKEKDNDRD